MTPVSCIPTLIRPQESTPGTHIDRLEVTALATLLPVAVVAATRASGAGVAEAQLAFVLSGGTALIVDSSHLTAARLARSAVASGSGSGCPETGRMHTSPVRAAGLTAAGCAALTALLIPLSDGDVSRAAGSAALASGLLAAGLLAPALPESRDGARDVLWRLLMVMVASAAVATSPLGLVLAATAVVLWLASLTTHGPLDGDRSPTAADLATPVVLLSAISPDPARERRRLDEHRFGVVSRGCEHRLADSTSPRLAALPADCRIDWWRASETVPVVNGAVAFALIEPALDHHPRLLVQVGDVVTGVLDRDIVAARPAEPVGGH